MLLKLMRNPMFAGVMSEIKKHRMKKDRNRLFMYGGVKATDEENCKILPLI